MGQGAGSELFGMRLWNFDFLKGRKFLVYVCETSAFEEVQFSMELADKKFWIYVKIPPFLNASH
jgi:hypothetical protein